MNLEKEKFTFENTTKLVPPSLVVRLIENIYNEAFGGRVWKMYTEAQPSVQDEAEYKGIVKMQISPDSLPVGAVQYTLNIDLIISIENAIKKDEALRKIQSTLGTGFGVIRYDGKDYKYYININQDPMQRQGVVDSEYMATVPIRATLSVGDEHAGVLYDMVGTYIEIGGTLHEIICSNSQKQTAFEVEQTLRIGSNTPDVEYISQTTTNAVTIHDRDDYICRLLRDWAYGELADEENPFFRDNKYVIKMVDVYPSESYASEYYVLSVPLPQQRGAYSVIQLNLQKVG